MKSYVCLLSAVYSYLQESSKQEKADKILSRCACYQQ